jgi:SpoIID/LytB domain protein
VEYTTEELTQLVSDNLKIDFGEITDLQPLERGKSGRISRLRIVGKNRSFVLGKELEIRRALSTSHLYSSAFVVDKKDGKFILTGAGWGHGVGLCQIGAAVMGEQGYDYSKILLHYYKNAEITKIY